MNKSEMATDSPWTEDELDDVLQRHQRLAERTNNPMFAWAALKILEGARVNVGDHWPSGRPITFPGWIAAYLFRVADQMVELSLGLDIRKPRCSTMPLEFENVQAFEEAIYGKAKQELEARQISKSDAMTLLSTALELTRPGGWNAFSSFAATTQKTSEYISYEAMKAAGMTAKKALHIIGQGIGVEDSSRLYARIREGRAIEVGTKLVVEPEG